MNVRYMKRDDVLCPSNDPTAILKRFSRQIRNYRISLGFNRLLQESIYIYSLRKPFLTPETA